MLLRPFLPACKLPTERDDIDFARGRGREEEFRSSEFRCFPSEFEFLFVDDSLFLEEFLFLVHEEFLEMPTVDEFLDIFAVEEFLETPTEDTPADESLLIRVFFPLF